MEICRPEIIGWGKYLPERRLTNEELVPLLGPHVPLITPEWIERRTGIKERRIAAPGETTANLATSAAIQALESANLDPHDVHEIIVATITPDCSSPSTACEVQLAIQGVKGKKVNNDTNAYDETAACAGFLNALAIAFAKIEAGMIDNALVIGAERMSRKTNYRDRQTAMLFADGAGAVVVRKTTKLKRRAVFRLKSDGSLGRLLTVPTSYDKSLASLDDPEFDHEKTPHQYIQMDGQGVFQHAVRLMAEVTKETMQTAGLNFDGIDLVIIHQANKRILDAVAEKTGMPQDKMFVNIYKYGNTSAASIPIALTEAAQEGLYTPDTNLALIALGAGFSYGAGIIFGKT